MGTAVFAGLLILGVLIAQRIVELIGVLAIERIADRIFGE